MEKIKEAKNIYKFIPCPQYDLSGMEAWLSDMAEKGLVLKKDGIFLGVATFEKSSPQTIRYSLQTSEKPLGFWSENFGDPDSEAIELTNRFGWEYVAKRGEFHIYRTNNPEARDLHTDKEVQALAMDAMKKRQKDSVFTSIFYGVVYPYFIMRGKVILTMIHVGTPEMFIMIIAGIWMTVHSILEASKLIKLKKKILNGQSLGSGKAWKKGEKVYLINNILRKCSYILAIIFFINILNSNIMHEEYIPLKEYTGEVPFKTMEDFIDNGEMKLMNMDLGTLNTVRQWTDILSSVNYEWSEAGEVRNEKGQILSGGLNVVYHETKSEWIAERLVTEYIRKGKQEKEFKKLEIQIEGLDEAMAYTTKFRYPNVVLRKGNKIIQARFYTTGGKSMEYEINQWASFLAESIID